MKDLSFSTLLLASCLFAACGAEQCQTFKPPECNTRYSQRYFPHETSCTLYYRCNDGVPEIFSCPLGTSFNNYLQICDEDRNVNCNRCVESNEIISTQSCNEIPTCSALERGKNKPYPPDCNKYIYCDKQGPGVLSKCPNSLHFSPDKKYCTSPEEANCPNCEETTTVEVLTTLEVCLETPKCLDSELGLFKPYPPDCTMYLYCDGESDGVLSKCQFNYHFSPDVLFCMTPEEANCPSCEVISTSDTTLEILTTIGICLETPKCSISETGKNKPYPPDCTLYLYCDGLSTGVLSKCQSNYHFNPDLLYCMPPDEANCPNCQELTTTYLPETSSVTPEKTSTIDITSSTDDVTSSTSEMTSTTTDVITTSSEMTATTTESTTDDTSTTSEISTTIGICPETQTCTIADHGYTKPYPPDCTKYIYCDENGDNLLSSCPPDLYYSPTLFYCTEESEANCPLCEVTTTEELSSTESTVTTIGICPEILNCTVSDIGKLLPYPPDCSLYIYCDENQEEMISSCEVGFHFSPKDLYCTTPEEANCPLCEIITSTTFESTTTEITTSTTNELTSTTDYFTTISICPATPTCVPSELGITKPFPEDCSNYIYCNGSSIATIRTCAAGNHYSPTLKRCVLEEEAGCPICYIPSTTEYFETTDPITSSTSEESTFSSTSSPSSECPEIPNCDFEVVGVVKPFPPNCSLYIYCDVNYTADIRKCKGDFKFDTKELTCLDPSISNCRDCITPTTESLDSTSIQSSTVSDFSTDITTLPQCEETQTCDIFDAGISKPYPPDCTKYIYCSFGESTIESCENDQHFSPINYECMDSNLANCPLCTEIITTTIESTTEQPSTTIIFTTEESTVESTVDSTVESTVDSTVESESSTVESTTDLSSTSESSAADSTTDITTTENSSTLPPCEMTPTCNMFDVGIMLVYPPNCTLYIYCSFGSPTLTACPSGQHFSPTEFICTDPIVANCPLCTEVDTTTEIPTTEIITETTTEEIISTTPEETTDLSSTTILSSLPPCDETPTCGIFDVGIHKPYPPDCTKYIYCDFGVANITSCPLGQHFSPTEYICVEPLQANCPLCSDVSPTTPDTTISLTETTEVATVESTTDENTSTTLDYSSTISPLPDCEPIPSCGIFDEGIMKPYPPSCREYIYCQIGNTYELRPCPTGQEFSPIENECMLASEAKCPLCNPVIILK